MPFTQDSVRYGAAQGSGTASLARRSPSRDNLDTRQIPLDSPLALFAPDHYLASSVPAPLYLLEFVPATLKNSYETGPDGTLVRKEDYFAERTIEDAAGSVWHIEAVASPKIGLPMQHDMDILLALLRIADEGGVGEDGSFVSPSYRQILCAAGREREGRDPIAAVKRALARWTVVVHTDASLDLRDLSARILAGQERPHAPDGSPERRTRTSAYAVLQYSVETEFRKDQTIDTIDRLQINPVWLSQARAGIAAWIDIHLHNALQSPWAKRIYRHLAARTALGWNPEEPVVITLHKFLGALGVRSTRRPTRVAAEVQRALSALQERGVVGPSNVRRLRKGHYEIWIEGGERLLTAASMRGMGSLERPRVRMLLAHLKSYGLSESEAWALVSERPMQVLSVLRYVQYVMAAKRGHVSPRKTLDHPAQWIKAAVQQEYRFEEPEYEAWTASRTREALTPRSPINLPPPEEASPANVSSEAASHEIPDNVWGNAIRACHESGKATDLALRLYLLRSTLEDVDETTVRVRAADTFVAEWIREKYAATLEETLSNQLDRLVTLEIESPASVVV